MKAIFNFQIRIDDKQTAVVFGMDECKGIDVEVMGALTKIFAETKQKITRALPQPAPAKTQQNPAETAAKESE